MFQPLVLSLFLYFPEDKSEYIPAAITFVIFLIGACSYDAINHCRFQTGSQKSKRIRRTIKKPTASSKEQLTYSCSFFLIRPWIKDGQIVHTKGKLSIVGVYI